MPEIAIQHSHIYSTYFAPRGRRRIFSLGIQIAQLRTTGTGNDGLIYATPEVLYRDMKSIILFEQDRNSFPLYCRTKTWETLPPERS